MALRVKDSGRCTALLRNDLIVLEGSGLDLTTSSGVCLEPLCQIYPVLRDMLVHGQPDGPAPRLMFPCRVTGCGAKFEVVTAPDRESRKAAREPSMQVKPDGPFLLRLPEAEARRIIAAGDMEVFEAGARLIEEDTVGRRLLIILEGRAEVFMGGQEDNVLATLGAADCVGELSLLTGQSTTAGVRASTRCKILCISHEKFDELLEDRPVLFRVFMKMLHERFKRTNEAVTEERQAAYRGRLETVRLPDLLQGICQARRDGVLHILREHQLARIGFRKGVPTGFVMQDVSRIAVNERFPASTRKSLPVVDRGLEAFLDIFGWEQGKFRFEENAEETRGPLELDLMNILMEGARRIDERSRAGR